jgi:hypothetical protein
MISSVRAWSRMESEQLAARPPRDLALGHLGHQALEALHPLAVERRQHQLALLEVLALVEQDHRVAAHDRLQDARALARVQDLRRGGEHLLHLVRVGEHHERRSAQDLQREPSPVARPATLQEADRPRPPSDGLDHPRKSWPGWKLSSHSIPLPPVTIWQHPAPMCAVSHIPPTWLER